MKLSEKEIVALAHGFIEHEITDKGLVFYKYTKRQRDYFKDWNDFFYRSTHSTNSVIIKFETDSSFNLVYAQINTAELLLMFIRIML